ncbi:plexin-2 isoform X2 [Rhipicephalus microplus]|uniref:plexin-2 isoform X2 n=1 Tax=Rhipicephalus microplus TaxID=6941 RepID=UPI003F6A693D
MAAVPRCSACVTSAFTCNWCFSENTCMYKASSCSKNVFSRGNSPQNSLVYGRQHCLSFGADSFLLLANGGAHRDGCRGTKPTQLYGQIPLHAGHQRQAGTGAGEVSQQQDYLLTGHGGRRSSHCPRGVVHHFSGQRACAPPPEIHPLRGPIEGGMQVTIEGSNLETSQEIYDKVKIGGIPCISTEYNFSVRVVCRTGVSGSPLIVDMVVGIRAGIRKGHKKFQFQQVMVRDIQPCTGPQSRGIRLYISGSNLDIDNNLTPYLDILPCTVDKFSWNLKVTYTVRRYICRTSC